MQLSGMIRTTCPPDQLLALLNDPAVLARMIPGGSEITQTSATEYTITMRKSLGPLKLTMPGKLVLTPIGTGLDRHLAGHAGHLIAGKINIELDIHLTTEADQTVLTYAGDLVASGLVSRLLGENEKRAQISLRGVFMRLKNQAEGGKTSAAAKPEHDAATQA